MTPASTTTLAHLFISIHCHHKEQGGIPPIDDLQPSVLQKGTLVFCAGEAPPDYLRLQSHTLMDWIPGEGSRYIGVRVW